MGSPILELENSSNWESVYTTSTVASTVPNFPDRHFPMESIQVPLQLDRHIIAVYPTSNTAKDWWISAGWLEQKIFTGIVVGGGLMSGRKRLKGCCSTE